MGNYFGSYTKREFWISINKIISKDLEIPYSTKEGLTKLSTQELKQIKKDLLIKGTAKNRDQYIDLIYDFYKTPIASRKTESKAGWIYVISNSPGETKIGMTKRGETPEDARFHLVRRYQTPYGKNFKMTIFRVDDRRIIEKEIHDKLDNFRKTERNEVFMISYENVLLYIKKNYNFAFN